MISHSDHFEWLLKIGMGWLGWTEQQTLDTDMAAIVLALEGRQDMLKAIFGSPEPEGKEPEPPKPQVSDDLVRSIFRHLTGVQKTEP